MQVVRSKLMKANMKFWDIRLLTIIGHNKPLFPMYSRTMLHAFSKHFHEDVGVTKTHACLCDITREDCQYVKHHWTSHQASSDTPPSTSQRRYGSNPTWFPEDYGWGLRGVSMACDFCYITSSLLRRYLLMLQAYDEDANAAYEWSWNSYIVAGNVRDETDLLARDALEICQALSSQPGLWVACALRKTIDR